MMLMFMVLTISISFCYGLENAKLNYKCSTEPDTMTVEAVYTGAGTPLTVVWSYSGDPGTTLEILVSTCKVFGSLPSGFPVASRLSYKCVTTHPSLSPNTYQLILADVQSDELKETWGVTFSPPVGVAPAAVQLPIPDDCISCKCDCEECKKRVWICISFSCIGIAPEVIFVVGLLIASFRKTNLVVFAAIVIVIEIISGGVCISVPAEKCCTECCENWYKPLSIVFAVVSFLVGVAGIAEFVLVLSNRIGPGRNAYKAKEPGENHGMTGTSM